MPKRTNPNLVNPTRLGGAGDRAVIDELWAEADRLDMAVTPEIRSRRAAPRMAYRREHLTLTLRPSGRDPQQRAAVGRDLSLGGIGFFVRGFVYKDTPCEITLTRHLGGTDGVSGVVAYCSYLTGPWHQVGVKFNERIFPALFLTPDQADELANTQGAGGRVEGDVLIVAARADDRRQIAMAVRKLGGKPLEADTAQTAVVALDQRRGDRRLLAVITDPGVTGGGQGSDATGELVERLGRLGAVPIIRLDTGEAVGEPRAAGARGTRAGLRLAKPITKAAVATALGLSVEEEAGDDLAIRSTLADRGPSQGDLAELLSAAVVQIRKLGVEIGEAVESGDVTVCRKLAEHLKFLGTSFRYVPVESIAAEAMAGLDATRDLAMCRPVLESLRGVCRRVVG